MRLPHRPQKREEGSDSSRNDGLMAFAIAALSVTCLLIIVFVVVRRLRVLDREPTLIPSQTLKKAWRNWNPGGRYGRVPVDSAGPQRQGQSPNATANADTSYAGAGPAVASVDRNTSVRSVMTLPSYSATPNQTEEVIGREGERAGMDVVVEFPETNDEEEARREEQMESLYQIRLARRQEQEERDERRRQRREAREQGDTVRLQELRQESRMRSRGQSDSNGNSSTIAMLLTEHQSRGRDRRVSSVSYADVGHVRHDGTRLRGTSQDSDSRPLLDNTGGLGDEAEYSLRTHHRAASGSSLASHSTAGSDHRISNANSEADIGELSVAPPPQYDHLAWGDAPPYQGPEDNNDNHNSNDSVPNDDAPELPQLNTLPSIAIETATPPHSTPITPVSPAPPNTDQTQRPSETM